MKPCPACGPLHDLDCVTCTRCGWVEELPKHSPAVQVRAALERLTRAIDEEYERAGSPSLRGTGAAYCRLGLKRARGLIGDELARLREGT